MSWLFFRFSKHEPKSLTHEETIMDTLEALEKSITVWEVVHRLNISKREAYELLNFEEEDCNCPLCEYTFALNNKTCFTGCPVWRGQAKLCMHNDSVYHKWEYAKQAYKQPYAKQVLQKLKDALISYEL